MKMKMAIFLIVALLITVIGFFHYKNVESLPVIAIANYGPHSSLDNTIKGIKEELARQGFKENENIRFQITDVGFDLALIPQMITNLKSMAPHVMIVIGTPIAQYAKNTIKDIPLVFTVITDPVTAGLLKEPHQAQDNITGVSDKQDLEGLLLMTKKLIPQAKKCGVLYATSEVNDLALVNMMKEAAAKLQMEVVAIPVDQARDVLVRMQAFNGKVDFIYVGASGAIQPTLPVIISEANKMHIPIFNVDEQAVLEHQVLGSFSVNYYQVGVNTALIVSRILHGDSINQIPPSYPNLENHQGFISSVQAHHFHLNIPKGLSNITVVD